MLVLTTRRKDADIFWFSLFHEIGHIINGDIFGSSPANDSETQADTFAANTLICPDACEQFIENNNFHEEAIVNFSEAIEIHPGIIVGRLQKERRLNYNEMNHLKVQYEFVPEIKE